jgi:GntR family transcriptional repressor for pyruvate dehydrogenase complex
MGLVEIRSGEGAFVREASPDAVIQPLAAMLALERGTFHQIYEVRRIMECAAAYLAAERATLDEIEQMREALVQMEQDLNNNRLGEVADNQFHLAVAAATHNPFLLSLRHTIADAIHQVVQSARKKLHETPGNAKKLLDQHRAIYEAIKEGRTDDAERSMYQHLIFSEGELAKEIPARLRTK